LSGWRKALERGRIRRTYRKREDKIKHHSCFAHTSVSNQTDTMLLAWDHSVGRLILLPCCLRLSLALTRSLSVAPILVFSFSRFLSFFLFLSRVCETERFLIYNI
jgi:hypothetical protein